MNSRHDPEPKVRQGSLEPRLRRAERLFSVGMSTEELDTNELMSSRLFVYPKFNLGIVNQKIELNFSNLCVH
jgi:hypothetical protein